MKKIFKHIYDGYKMKNKATNARFFRLFFMIFLLGIIKINAQNYPIELTVQTPPPFSPYFSDYWEGKNNTMIILRNTENSTKRIKIAGSINGRNGISIYTKPNFTPLAPIVLGPNQTRTLIGRELKPYMDVSNFEVVGIDKNELARMSALPEGDYDICFRAMDFDNSVYLSAPSPMGCSYANIMYPEPPILVMPVDGDTIKSIAATAPVMFTWTYSPSSPFNTQYKLQIAEMVNPNANPAAVMNSTSRFLLDKRTDKATYITVVSDPPFVEGKTYAWRVIAFDPLNKTVFRNGGVSECRKFTYTKFNSGSNGQTVSSELNNISLYVPNCENNTEVQNEVNAQKTRLNGGFNINDKFNKSKQTIINKSASIDKTDLENIKKTYYNKFNDGLPIIFVNNDNDFYVLWKNLIPYSGIKTFAKYAVRFNNVENGSYLIKSYQIIKDPAAKSIPNQSAGNSLFDTSTYDFAYLNIEKNALPNGFKNEKKYEAIVDCYDQNGVKIASSKPCIFRYVVLPESMDDSTTTYTVKGNIKYKFDGDPEKYPLSIPSIQLKRYFLIRDTSTLNVLKSGIETSELFPGTIAKSIPVNLDENGNFSVNVNARINGGDMGVNKTYSYYLNNDPDSYGKNKAYGRVYEYYVLTLNSPYFLEPQTQVQLNADSVNLGEVTVNVFSYDAKIEIATGFQKGNGSGEIPKFVNVSVFRFKNDIIND